MFRMRSTHKLDESGPISPLALSNQLPSPRSVTFAITPPPSPLPTLLSSPSHELTSLNPAVTSTIAEVLNLPSEGLVNLSSVSELASKAKGLQSDNRRLRDEMRDLAAEREALSLEIERLRSAMRDVVRVAEIIAIPQCRCRSASSSIPSSPASSIFPHTHTDS